MMLGAFALSNRCKSPQPVNHCNSILSSYVQFIYLGSPLLNFLLLDIAGSLTVAGKLIFVCADSPGHGAQIRIVAEQLGHRDVRLDDLLAVMVGIHAEHTAAPAV